MIALARFGEVRTLGLPVFVLALINFVSLIGIAVMLPLLPLYALSFQATPLQLGLLTSAFAAANAASQFASGFALDRIGARTFMRAGTAIYAGANALIATAGSALALVAYRTLAGLGSGGNIVASRVYVAETADPRRLALTQGILSAAASAGSVAGPAASTVWQEVGVGTALATASVAGTLAVVPLLALPRELR